MNMKIGIMSMQRIINYGSYMQAFSLKNLLEEMGNEVVFVDYKVDMLAETKKSYDDKKFRFFRLLKRKLQTRIKKEKSNTLKPLQRFFEEAYRQIGVEINRKYHTKVDVLVVGSDEVFNCLQLNPDVGYSLELFGKNNKARMLISYAASFGDTTIDRLKRYGFANEIAHYLKKFDALSVRDKNSKHIIDELTGSVPAEHFDPTLVSGIEKLYWKECSKKGYIAVYGYGYRFNEEEGEAIKRFAQKRSLDIVILNAPQKLSGEYVVCRPEEIFGYFKNAEYIVTDTFHGTIFSVLFRKPVAVFSRSPQNVAYSNENKILDLVEKLDIKSQLVLKPSKLEEVLLHNIDYDRIEKIRQKERDRTIKYLKEYCGNKI